MSTLDIVVIAVILVLLVAALLVRVSLRAVRDETRSVERYNHALRRLSTLPERAAAGELRRPVPARPVPARPAPARPVPARPVPARPVPARPVPARPVPARPVPARPVPARPVPAHPGLAALSSPDGSWLALQAARVVGLHESSGPPDPNVEANARLTGGTGLVLVVLIFAEGLTIPFIVRLFSWHIIIGLILVPPLLVKIGSVLWRFGRYYLHDPRYRRAGPPHPLLRVIGPLLMGSTVVLFASGIVLWLAGPTDQTMLHVHQLSFVFWIGVLAVHLASHLLRATRLAAADAGAARRVRGGDPHLRRGARRRRTLIAASLVVGLAVGIAARRVSTPWATGSPSRPALSSSALASVRLDAEGPRSNLWHGAPGQRSSSSSSQWCGSA